MAQSDELLRTLQVGVSWVVEARLSNQEEEIDRATGAFLRLAEIACDKGIEADQLRIVPGSSVDGPTLARIIGAVRPRSRPALTLVPNTTDQPT